ncbi:MAG TPA: FG-GAP-like repeat-containing protein [Blastocatellia bacterium]|nr:FG-GAP-like repeat-containing protein [Blastocatellia bacterium]
MKSAYNATLISIAVAAILFGNWRDTRAQQPPPAQSTPSQSQPRTGRSYSSRDPIKPPTTTAPQAPSPVTFADITPASGVTFKHAASPTSQKYLPESMGAGVAMLDYDNDGRLDLFFTNGARLDDPMPKGAMPDKREAKYWNRLYHQKSDGTFEDVTERAGVKGEGYSMGVAAADYDNDGWVDIYVTGYGVNILYRNGGDGTFADVSKKVGINASGWCTSAAWLDYDRDGLLDLFIARYMEWDFERGSIYCGEPRPGLRAYCHPDNFKGATNLLYHQKAGGSFEDVSAASKISDPSGKGLGVAIADFDGDGWPDIAVANDSVRQSLYHNRGDGSFEDIALPAGIGYDENGKTFAGMGVDAADYDDDGYTDIFMTALSNETYPLFHNNGDKTFTYDTNMAGIGQATVLYSGWGARFVDVDNDGLRDIFVAQGHVLDTIEKTSSYLKYKQPLLLMRNTGKGFISVSPTAGQAFSALLAARGAAVGDLNNDGQPDIVIGVIDSAPVILRNNGTKNHWLGLSLVGAKSNRSAIGARVTVTDAAGRKRIYDVTTGGSYLSSGDPRVLIGLGTATTVKSVEVRWPGSRAQTIENPALDRYHTIKEG